MVSSAGNTRGLIEAAGRPRAAPSPTPSSAGNTRGLIEATVSPVTDHVEFEVFRGEYPRPH